MQLPVLGARIRAGANARVLALDPPNRWGNVRCIVAADDGRLGWIMYYAAGTRSNINFFPPEKAAEVRGRLETSAGE
ncbi:MAG: hypothetical protein ACOX2L_01260 [Anaerolineae bacterium]|nr:hypothetical protein [Chloroflexota bacterium]